MRRALLVLAVTLGMLVLTPSPSWACSCALATTAQHVRQAGTVAAGTIGWTATDGETRTYKVDVDSVYKGAAATSEKLVTRAEGAACGLGSLTTGKRYLFFVDGVHPGTMRVGICGGTTRYDATVAAEVESVTGPPGKPLSPPADVGDDASGHAARNTVVGLGVGLLVLLVARSTAGRRRPGRSV